MAENTDPETPENEPVSIPPGTAETEMGDMEVVAIDDLNVDHAYQRDLDAGLVQRIAAGWDIVASGPIVVSRRPDGSLWIVNGQHRAAAAKVAGETHILAQVKSVAGMTPDEARVYEAELRLKGNTRRTDKSQERFRAQVAARHADSLAIVEIASKFNTRINPWNDQKHGINSVSAVERLYRKNNGVLLTRVFEFIRDAFGEVGGAFASVAMLNAIAWLLERHDQEMNRSRMVERLGVEGIEALDRKARAHKGAMGGALWTNYYRAMIEIYNTNLPQKSRLEWRTNPGPSSPEQRSAESAAQEAAQQTADSATSDEPPQD
jgi:hypothetical protein